MSGDQKTYLGDAVYARIDDYGAIWLTTEDGIRSTNVICLEREVISELLDFIARTKQK